MRVSSLVRGWAILPLYTGTPVYCYGRMHMSATKMASSSSWRPYLVEFRGSAPAFRFAELNDAALSTIGPVWSSSNAIDYTAVVPDTQSSIPVCVYVKLPDDNAANELAKRCSLVRRILQVWGDGSSPQEALLDAQTHFETRVDHVISAGTGKGTWRMQFERFGKEGRSGMSDEERRDLLTQLAPIGLKFKGRVDLKAPEHHLVYLEDWHTYHAELHTLIADIKAKRQHIVSSSEGGHSIDPTETPDVVAARELKYKPLRCIIGRVVGEGPQVVTKFDLRNRPFIGTTSMNALSAHLSVNAARVQPGHRVLDPFCGTGSLLVAAASLGVDVVGSDIDAAGLLGERVVSSSVVQGAVSTGSALAEAVVSSKNARFTRKGGADQMGLCVMDNFEFYNLRDRVVDMVGVSVDKWLFQDSSVKIGDIAFTSEWERDEYSKISKHDKFDAIITDPPFGKRERAENEAYTTTHSLTHTPIPSLSTFECLGDPSAVLVTLFRVALQRLRPGGMLVFWLPTKAFTTAEEVGVHIGNIQAAALHREAARSNHVENGVVINTATSASTASVSGITAGTSSTGEMQLLRVTAEELNDNMWRWLCVLQRS